MKKLFENWRRFVTEQEGFETEFIDPTELEPEFIEDEQPADIQQARDNILKMADEKLKKFGNFKPLKGQNVIVQCITGYCPGQFLANDHMPFWGPGIEREFKRKYGRKMGRKMYSMLKLDRPGKFGHYKQGISKLTMAGRPRKSKPEYIVVHSSTTKNPHRTVAALMGRKGNEGLGFGTNYEIYFDGTIYQYHDDSIATPHASGHNNLGIGIDLTGGGKTGPGHTSKQIEALNFLIKKLASKHGFPTSVAPVEEVGVYTNARKVKKSGYGVFAHYNLTTNRNDPGTDVMSQIG